MLIGTISDLLEEIKTVVQLAADSASEKIEPVDLLRTLLLRYPHIRRSSFRDAVTLYICKAAGDCLAYEIALIEATSLWEGEPTSKRTITHL